MGADTGFVGSVRCAVSTCSTAVAASQTTWTCGQNANERKLRLSQCRESRLQREFQPIRCFRTTGGGRGDGDSRGNNGDDEGILGGDPNSDENDGYQAVVLDDPATGRILPCVVEHEVDVMDATYLVCCPEDDVVTFATENGEEGLVCLSDESLIDQLFPTAAAVLAEDHVTLKRTAYLMTVDDSDAAVLGSGEFDDNDDDDDDEAEDDRDGDEWEGGEDDDDDSEAVSVLGEFRHNNINYFVLKPENPVLLVARRSEGKLIVVEEDELEYVSPIIEAQIEELEREDEL
jgi:Protein of unknown function (DUF3727)